jgi:hypothetical protein
VAVEIEFHIVVARAGSFGLHGVGLGWRWVWARTPSSPDWRKH